MNWDMLTEILVMKLKEPPNKIKVFQTYCQKNATYLIKMVGKIYYEESRGECFNAYVKKQDTYCLRCEKEQIINQLQKNKW